MASIKGRDTQPELSVRKALWATGKRYRTHDRSVLGTPDISNKRKRLAVFIDGCFWHGCATCYRQPTSNVNYWKKKIVDNQRRRYRVLADLQRNGWTVLQFWEHEVIRNSVRISASIAEKL